MEEAVHVIGRCSTYWDANPVWYAWDTKTRIRGEGPSFQAAADDLMQKLGRPTIAIDDPGEMNAVARAARSTHGNPAQELADARDELKLQAGLITKLWGRIAQLQNALREAQATQPTGRE